MFEVHIVIAVHEDGSMYPLDAYEDRETALRRVKGLNTESDRNSVSPVRMLGIAAVFVRTMTVKKW